MTDIEQAKEIYRRYHRRYDGEVQGCCSVIADDILNEIGGVAVAGYLCFGGCQRSHWWVEKDGIVLDPMGDDLMSYEKPGTWSRQEEYSADEIPASILSQYEQWRVTP